MELYLDNAATSKIDLDVLEEYYRLLKTYFASTGSLHSLGEEVLTLENKSKEKIAKLLKVKPNEILFNSGATEGNNYAIKGVAFKYKNRGNTIITSKVEHPSVLKCFEQLEKEYNFNCIYLDVNENGIIDLNELKKHLNNDVILVSIMYVNHEVGTIMPIKQISSLLKEYPKIIFHSDITQAIGKVDIDLSSVDIATMSAHKIHGIKGSGFMYKKEKIELFPLISGHNANNAMRAGTSNWPSNVVMSKALENSLNFLKENAEKMRLCQNKLISSLKNIASVVVNTNLDYCISSIVNFSLPGYNSEVIIRALSYKNIYVSSRSVCSKNSKETYSVTLKAMNRPLDVINSSIRVSFAYPLNDSEIEYFVNSLKDVLKTIRRQG